MENFSSTEKLVTLGLVDSSIGTASEVIAPDDFEISIAKYFLYSYLIHTRIS